MPKFRRGAAAIREAATRKTGGAFKPFAPEFSWKDGDEKYLLFLTPIPDPEEDNAEDGVATVDLHEWIETGKGKRADGSTYVKYNKFVCRTVDAIGEDKCKLCQLNHDSSTRCIGVAVELEPITETERGRKKIVGFRSTTRDFTRKVRGDDGDDSTEEVTAPNVGFVSQASANFYNYLEDFNLAPIETVPFAVKRDGDKTNTTYHFVHFDGKPVDLSSLVEHLDNISYLGDDLDAVKELVADAGDDHYEASYRVATAMLNRYLDELADGDRFSKLTDPIDHIEPRFGGGGKKEEKAPQPRRPERKATQERSEEELSRSEKFRRLKKGVEEKNKANA